MENDLHIPRRAALLGTIGLGALAVATKSASATNITYETATYLSSGTAASAGTLARSAQVRWGDWINVKDYGATGNGSTDDTTAIQAAINAAAIQNTVQGAGYSARIYFPGGTYKVTTSLNIEALLAFVIQGDGTATTINGNLSGAAGSPYGYVFHGPIYTSTGWHSSSVGGKGPSGPGVFRDLNISNTTQAIGSGCIWMPWMQYVGIWNCNFKGFNCVNLSNGNNGGNPSSVVGNCGFNCAAATNAFTGSWAIALSNSHGSYNNDIVAFEHAIRTSNTGVIIHGGRFEQNHIGVAFGITDVYGTAADGSAGPFGGITYNQALTGTEASQGTSVAGMSFEANDIAVTSIGGASNIVCGPFTMEADVSSPAGGSLNGIIASGDHWKIVCVGGGGFANNGIQLPNGDSTFSCENCFINNSGGGTSGGAGNWSGGNCARYDGCNRNTGYASMGVSGASGFKNYTDLPSGGQIPDLNYKTWIKDGSTATIGATCVGSGSSIVELQFVGGTTWRVSQAGP